MSSRADFMKASVMTGSLRASFARKHHSSYAGRPPTECGRAATMMLVGSWMESLNFLGMSFGKALITGNALSRERKA